MSKAYQDLLVWQKAMDLTVEVYRLTDMLPRSELYGLSSQMRRCAVSIPSNIAEGSARGTKKDFRQFVLIAKGSICELHTQILLCQRLNYAQVDDLRRVGMCAVEVRRMLSGLAAYLKKSADSKNLHLPTRNS